MITTFRPLTKRESQIYSLKCACLKPRSTDVQCPKKVETAMDETTDTTDGSETNTTYYCKAHGLDVKLEKDHAAALEAANYDLRPEHNQDTE